VVVVRPDAHGATELANVTLAAAFDELAQSEVDQVFLGARGRQAEGFGHQVFVRLDAPLGLQWVGLRSRS
jgi:hypothetical protein